jgi:plastocyanin
MTLVHRTWRLALVAGLLLLATGVAVPALANPADVSIVDKSFQPASITIQAGDTVTWTVTQSIGEPHSVTSGTPGAIQGKEFDSGIGLKDNGQSFQFTFQQPGTYDYFCQVHPAQMIGQVIVQAPGASAPAANGGPTGSPAASAAAASPAASPAATQTPVAPEASEPISPERRLIAAGILAATLVVLFGAAMVWRRMNPA